VDARAYSHENFERALASLDITLFDHFRSQTALRDRLSLLALHNACRDFYGTFRYLEIGSYLGGSLQALIRDPRCVEIVSIDARADVARDDLKGEVAYENNTTERMLENLRSLPGADLTKLRTFDASTEDLEDVGPFRPQLCFIDAEHTHEGALRDARFCRRMMEDGVIAFHDRAVVRSAIDEFLGDLPPGGHSPLALRGGIRIVEIGGPNLIPRVEALLRPS
jgi:hypothetical protein